MAQTGREVVKRRINPEVISLGTSNGTKLQLNGIPGKSTKDSGNVGAPNASVEFRQLGPKEEAKAATAAGMVGRRIFLELNKTEVTHVSWKQLLVEAGARKLVVPEPKEAASPEQPQSIADRKRVNPLNTVIANLERQHMRAAGGSSSSEEETEPEEEEEVEDDDEKGSSMDEGGSDQANKEVSGSGKEDTSSEKSNLDEESGDESENEKDVAEKEKVKRQKNLRQGEYDYEDDFIDDTDLIELAKASRKKSKLDGFFVIKGGVEGVDEETERVKKPRLAPPARLKVKKPKPKKLTDEAKSDLEHNQQNGKVKKRKNKDVQDPVSGPPQKKKKQNEGIGGGSENDQGRRGAVLKRRQAIFDQSNSHLGTRMQELLQALEPKGEAFRAENEGIVSMSIPKSMNKPLSGIACLLAHPEAQTKPIQDAILTEVHELFDPIFSRSRLRVRLGSLGKTTKDDLVSAESKLQEHVATKLRQAEEKRNEGYPEAKFAWDKNMDHYVLTYASNYSKVHCQDSKDLQHLSNLLKLWPEGEMDMANLKEARQRAIDNPKPFVKRKSRKSQGSSDASEILRIRHADADQNPLPCIAEEEPAGLAGAGEGQKALPRPQEDSSSEATETDPESPAAKLRHNASNPNTEVQSISPANHHRSSSNSPVGAQDIPQPGASLKSPIEEPRGTDQGAEQAGNGGARPQPGVQPGDGPPPTGGPGSLAANHHATEETRHPAFHPAVDGQVSGREKDPSPPALPTRESAQAGQTGSANLPRAGSSVSEELSSSDSALRAKAISQGADPSKVELSWKKYEGHPIRSILNKVLLHAGPKGSTFPEVCKLADMLGMTGSTPWATADPPMKKRLYAALKNSTIYLLSINLGVFAHSAFPGNVEAAAAHAEVREAKRKAMKAGKEKADAENQATAAGKAPDPPDQPPGPATQAAHAAPTRPESAGQIAAPTQPEPPGQTGAKSGPLDQQKVTGITGGTSGIAASTVGEALQRSASAQQSAPLQWVASSQPLARSAAGHLPTPGREGQAGALTAQQRLALESLISAAQHGSSSYYPNRSSMTQNYLPQNAAQAGAASSQLHGVSTGGLPTSSNSLGTARQPQTQSFLPSTFYSVYAQSQDAKSRQPADNPSASAASGGAPAPGPLQLLSRTSSHSNPSAGNPPGPEPSGAQAQNPPAQAPRAFTPSQPSNNSAKPKSVPANGSAEQRLLSMTANSHFRNNSDSLTKSWLKAQDASNPPSESLTAVPNHSPPEEANPSDSAEGQVKVGVPQSGEQ